MFADDCTIIQIGTEQSYNTRIDLFEGFGKLSGLNLNFSKCISLKIGSLRNEHDLIYSKKKKGNHLIQSSWHSLSIPNKVGFKFELST